MSRHLPFLCVTAFWIAVSSAHATDRSSELELADRLGRHAVAMSAKGKYEEALQAGQRALDIYQSPEDERQILELRGFLGLVHFQAEQYEDAIDIWDEILPRVRRELPPQMVASLLAHVGLAKERTGQLQAAVTHLEEAIPLIRQLDNEPALARWLHNLASVYQSMGRLSDAASFFEEALALDRKLPNPRGEADTLTNLGATYRALGRYADALDCLKQAEQIYLDLGLPGGLWRARSNRAVVHHTLGNRKEALQLYREVVPALRRLGSPRDLAAAASSYGTLLQNLGRYDEARPLLTEALEARQASKDRAGEAVARNNLSVLDWAAGHFEQAVDHAENALRLRRSTGDRAGEISTLVNLSHYYADLGSWEEAMDRLRQAREISREVGNPRLEAGMASKLAQVLYSLGHVEKSMEQARLAIRLGKDLHASASSLAARVVLFAAHLKLGQEARAEALLDEALRDAEALGPYQIATLRMFRGALAALQGDPKAALVDLGQALDLHRQHGLKVHLESILTVLGMVHLALGERDKGEALLREAIEHRDEQVGTMQTADFVAGIFGDRLSPHSVLLQLLASEDRAEDAFDVAEQTRSRGFLMELEQLAPSFPTDDDNPWFQEAIKLREQMTGLQRQARMERWRLESDSDTELRRARELDELQRRYENVLLQLKRTAPETASLVHPSPLTASEIQELLPPSTALVTFFVLPGHTISWMIDRNYVDMGISPIGRDAWEARARYFRQAIQRREPVDSFRSPMDWEVFAHLPSPRHVRHLILVPHGPLHDLPLEMFPGPDREQPLFETHTITRLPSVSILPHLLDKQSPFEGRVAVLGAPEDNLPGSRRESQEVAAVWGTDPLAGVHASESALRSLAGRVDLLHLATHARFDSARPLFSHISLASDPEHDGRLETHEILGLDLRGTDLIVLSACETGAEIRTSADDGTGLVRALLYAGAPAVLTTLWPVEDGSTAKLMADFHRRLEGERDPARALRHAKREASADPERSHPYHWAGFTLTGLTKPFVK